MTNIPTLNLYTDLIDDDDLKGIFFKIDCHNRSCMLEAIRKSIVSIRKYKSKTDFVKRHIINIIRVATILSRYDVPDLDIDEFNDKVVTLSKKQYDIFSGGIAALSVNYGTFGSIYLYSTLGRLESKHHIPTITAALAMLEICEEQWKRKDIL